MKCPICNGKGTQFIADYDGMYDIVCYKCKGKGELDENGKPILTNEEYLRTCTTEQLAEWLQEHMDCIGCPASCEMCHRYYDACKDTMLGWLKQPHITIKE